MLWLFVLTLSLLFVLLFSIMVVKACTSAEHSFLWFMMNEEFYHIHHSYMALYILAGLAFLYSELVRKEKLRVRQLVLTLVCCCCLILFLLCINSRAGLLCLILLMVLCWMHQCFIRKKYRFAVWSLVAMLLLVVVAHFALPDHFRRLSATAEQVAQGDKSDSRFVIMANAWAVVSENPVLGVGAGDRMDVLTPFYVSENRPDATVYSPHNQYLDTWMATGLPGLLSLLALLILPLILAWRKRNIFSFLLLLMLMLSLMFESMLERQMGIAFTAVIYVYMLLFFQLDSFGIITTKFPQDE